MYVNNINCHNKMIDEWKDGWSCPVCYKIGIQWHFTLMRVFPQWSSLCYYSRMPCTPGYPMEMMLSLIQWWIKFQMRRRLRLHAHNNISPSTAHALCFRFCTMYHTREIRSPPTWGVVINTAISIPRVFLLLHLNCFAYIYFKWAHCSYGHSHK